MAHLKYKLSRWLVDCKIHACKSNSKNTFMYRSLNFTHEVLFMEISKNMIWRQVYNMNKDEHKASLARWNFDFQNCLSPYLAWANGKGRH